MSTFRRTAVVTLAVLSLACPAVGSASAATKSAAIPTSTVITVPVGTVHNFTAAETATSPTVVNGHVFSGAAWDAMSPQERADLLNKLGDFGRAAAAAGSGTVAAPGSVQPNWNIGLGWNVYFHDMSPSDQRWFLQVGAIAAGGAICAASAGALCAAAGVIAAAVAIGVSEYYHPTCWITVETTYSGRLVALSVDHC